MCDFRALVSKVMKFMVSQRGEGNIFYQLIKYLALKKSAALNYLVKELINVLISSICCSLVREKDEGIIANYTEWEKALEAGLCDERYAPSVFLTL